MKTKIYLTAAAVATLTLGSCSQDQVVEQSFDAQPKAIEFGVYTGKAAESRGVITNSGATSTGVSTGIQSTGFGINATYTGQESWNTGSAPKVPNFMYNQKVEYDANANWGSNADNDWKYSPIKYWPTMTGDKLSFFAWAPYAAAGIDVKGDNVAANQLDFEVQNTASAMVDFVAGNAINQQHGISGANDASARAAVDFDLYHELTRLNFKAKVDANINPTIDGKTYVIVKTVQLEPNATDGEFYTKATYTFNNAQMNETTRGTWDYDNATRLAKEYPIDIVNAVSQETTLNSNYKTEGVAVKDDVDTDDKAVSLFENNEYLFLIPASGSGASDEGLAEGKTAVTFTYDIVTLDDNLNLDYSCTNSEKTVYLPKGIMKQGLAYNLIFTFYMDAIEVSAEVTDWPNDLKVNEDVPYSPDDETANTNSGGGTPVS